MAIDRSIAKTMFRIPIRRAVIQQLFIIFSNEIPLSRFEDRYGLQTDKTLLQTARVPESQYLRNAAVFEIFLLGMDNE